MNVLQPTKTWRPAQACHAVSLCPVVIIRQVLVNDARRTIGRAERKVAARCASPCSSCASRRNYISMRTVSSGRITHSCVDSKVAHPAGTAANMVDARQEVMLPNGSSDTPEANFPTSHSDRHAGKVGLSVDFALAWILNICTSLPDERLHSHLTHQQVRRRWSPPHTRRMLLDVKGDVPISIKRGGNDMNVAAQVHACSIAT